jgi:hypothetical protein
MSSMRSWRRCWRSRQIIRREKIRGGKKKSLDDECGGRVSFRDGPKECSGFAGERARKVDVAAIDAKKLSGALSSSVSHSHKRFETHTCWT